MTGLPDPVPMPQPDAPSGASLRGRLIVGSIVVVPLLAIVLVVALFASLSGPAASPSPSIDPGASPTPTATPGQALVEARCLTVPVDAVYAFGTLPLPPGSTRLGDEPARQGSAFVAARYRVTWPEGGFAAWVARDLRAWTLAGDVFLDGGREAATLRRAGEETSDATALLVVIDAETVTVELPERVVGDTPSTGTATPLSLARAGDGDACALLSAYILLDGPGGEPALATDLSGFVARPVGGGPEISATASNTSLRPERLPDGGWRIPLQAGVEYRLFYTVDRALQPLYDVGRRGSGVCDALIVATPDGGSITRRSILRIDARAAETDRLGLCAGGRFAELETAPIRTPERTEVIIPELNGLAVGVLYGESLRYNKALLDKLAALAQAEQTAGLLGTILFYAGVGAGVLSGWFAFYVLFVMDKKRAPARAPGRGLARPVGRGRR
jgi:hypothetical protein